MAQDSAISGALNVSLATIAVMIAFVSIAIYNSIELLFVVVLTFKRRSGVYFFSILVATIGIFLNAIGYTCKYFRLIPIDIISATLILIGWCSMITGQSVVLYSRLHLVVRDPRRIRWVLILIITNAIILHIPIIVLVYGANSSNPGPFIPIYSIYEKVQLTVFFVQELIISGLYVYETFHILKPADTLKAKSRRTVLTHLIYVNIIVILLDITLLGIEYSGHYEIQTSYKAALYSVKLKLEFSILNRLIMVIKGNNSQTSNTHSHPNHSMPLDTLVHRHQHDRPSGGATHSSCNAYSITNNQLFTDIEGNSTSVMKTTEVIIERSRSTGLPGDDDSMGDKSGKEIEGLEAVEGLPQAGRIPKGPPSVSSSEAAFAKAGY
jgi:hypothetical protein